MREIPELLAPAGSYESLCAAIEAGADAVYMGGSFNARAFARNFDNDAIAEAIALCHSYGVKAYITLNTLVYERELHDWLEYAEYLYEAGADAFIVADLGAACALRQYIPDVRIHASTQMSVHNSEGAKLLSELGFERVVVARELSKENILRCVNDSGCEIEAFVHGALCVSASGQCLFSSLVGGRSGNRGECAQPCRLSYNGAPVLSLKDNCLASHIRELISLGVSSLKIEGRMKSPEYVYGTVSVYRRLLDQRRDASREELRELEELFCRSGFTDGYFVGKKEGMCGVRTEEDKKKSEGIAAFSGLKRRIPLRMRCSVRALSPARLELECRGARACVLGAVAQSADNAPIDEKTISRSLCKLGGTAFECAELELDIDGASYLRVSELNALRRDGIEALLRCFEPQRSGERGDICRILCFDDMRDGKSYGAAARFQSEKTICDIGNTRERFSRLFVPLGVFEGKWANGVECPPLVYDSEWQSFESALARARELGARYALCENISQIRIAKKLGYVVCADLRLNCTNPLTARELVSLGADEIVLSVELKTGAMRDIKTTKGVVTYGRIPLMITEKCVVGECGGCESCKRKEPFYLRDRTGAEFFVRTLDGHRSEIYNSVVTYSADAVAEKERIGTFSEYFIFTDEKPDEVREVVCAYERRLSRKGKYRRI